MGRGRRAESGSNEVTIKIIAAASIVPNPIEAVARKNQTWQDFLRENGLQLTPKDGIYVRTSHNRDVSKNRDWHGFSGELNEKIETFLAKYTLQRKAHTVRLMRRKPVINYRPPLKVVSGQRNRSTTRGSRSREAKLASRQFVGGLDAGEEEEAAVASTSGQLALVVQAVKTEVETETNNQVGGGGGGEIEAPTTTQQADAHGDESNELVIRRIKLESIELEDDEVPEQRQEDDDRLLLPPPPPQLEEAEDEEEENDTMSVMTSASQDVRDLRRRGIRIEDLKNPAIRRLEGIGNGYLLRARQEIKRLKKEKTWMRNHQRAPLACYLLEQLLKP